MRTTTAPDQLYEADFYAWTRQQVLALRRFARTRPNLPIDLEHIAEEIQDLGKSERDTVCGLARQLMQHPLLLEHSPATEPRRHWADGIDEFRARMKSKFSPASRRHLKRDLGAIYGDGRRIVERKMRRYDEAEAIAALPADCPYTIEQVLGDWLPQTEARSP